MKLKSQLANIIAFVAAVTISVSLSACSQSYVPESKDAAESIPAVELPGTKAVEYPDSADIAADGTSDEPARNDTTSDASNANVSDSVLRVRFIDVGQGDCALITCDGESLLIDGGPSSASSKLYSILQTLDIRNLDYVISTHPDADHCGGLAGALQFATCSVFYSPVKDHDTKTFKSILDRLGGTPVTIPSYGDIFYLGNAKVQFVGPVRNSSNSNSNSLVCRIDLGESSFLFTGDAEMPSETMMLRAGADVDVDVLKVAHHGSKDSTGEPFIEAVRPEYAVISVGKNNYGHPSDVVMSRLASCGSTLFRTDQDGSVIFDATDTSISVYCTKGKITS